MKRIAAAAALWLAVAAPVGAAQTTSAPTDTPPIARVVAYQPFEDGSASLIIEYNLNDPADELSYVVLVIDAETGKPRVSDYGP
jgi:hypothetical protein